MELARQERLLPRFEERKGLGPGKTPCRPALHTSRGQWSPLHTQPDAKLSLVLLGASHLK